MILYADIYGISKSGLLPYNFLSWAPQGTDRRTFGLRYLNSSSLGAGEMDFCFHFKELDG